MFANFWKWLNDIMGNFRDFVISHHGNPFMWIGFFVLGLLVFAFLYNTLTKHK